MPVTITRVRFSSPSPLAGEGRGEGARRAALSAVATLCLLFLFHLPAFAAHERDLTLAGLAVTEWEADTPPAGQQPLVIFSHGFHGCATQSRFLMRALADAGYLVFAPNHRDAVCHGGASHWYDRPEQSFVQPQAWTDATYRDRADDLFAVVRALHEDLRWNARIDWHRFALAGHSLGGYTVLGLAGAWPSWRMPGVRAVLALSPYTEPYLGAGTLRGLAAPVMYQGGTLDFGLTPSLSKTGGAYDQSPAPKYLVTFQGATHLAWADVGFRDHADIAAYALAFLNRALNGVAAPMLRRPGAGVAALRAADP